MKGLKNKTAAALRYSFNGVQFNFGPKEIRILPDAVANHLINTSFTCAIGGTPLEYVPEEEIADELAQAETAAASPSLVLLHNVSAVDVRIMHNAITTVIPAGKSSAFPKEIAEALITRRVLENKNDLSLEAPATPAEPTDVPAEAPEAKRTYTRRKK